MSTADKKLKRRQSKKHRKSKGRNSIFGFFTKKKTISEAEESSSESESSHSAKSSRRESIMKVDLFGCPICKKNRRDCLVSPCGHSLGCTKCT
mmetsp:Transcript_38606/g.34325  ORF Transcript_38606/g.34325 Transcript_38606/m.34325 type:complete len:93 (+) Transcript_38606:739-1017(+)